jgi:hypothetical protein
MPKMNGSAQTAKTGGTSSKAAAGQPPRKPPENARIIKSSARTGTITRAAARAAAKALIANR